MPFRRILRLTIPRLPRIAATSALVGILAAVHYYFYLRLAVDPALPRSWQRGLALALGAAALSIPAAASLGRLGGVRWRRLLARPAYLWMGCMSILFVLLVFGEVARGMLTLSTMFIGSSQLAAAASPLLIARVFAAAAVLFALALSAIAIVSATSPRVRRVRVALKKLPQAHDGLVIVQISDLHVGLTVRRRFLQDIVSRVNALKPDVIAITGDLVEGDVADLRHDVAPITELQARYGVYFVMGNHDHYSGASEWAEHLTSIGIRVLRNERVSVGDGEPIFDLAGVDDWSFNDALDASRASPVLNPLAAADLNRELILLAHQPRDIEFAARHNVGLMLSGHTHGGQLWPWGLIVRLTQPYVEGLHLHEDKTWIYVSRGTGYWGPPMRLGASAEITRIELSRAASASAVR